jgi:hypothetical protein
MSNWNFKLFWQILYCSVCLSDSPNDPSDFFPLLVHYQERLSAAGRTRYRKLKLFFPPFSPIYVQHHAALVLDSTSCNLANPFKVQPLNMKYLLFRVLLKK